jgi:hypothetical protein
MSTSSDIGKLESSQDCFIIEKNTPLTKALDDMSYIPVVKFLHLIFDPATRTPLFIKGAPVGTLGQPDVDLMLKRMDEVRQTNWEIARLR